MTFEPSAGARIGSSCKIYQNKHVTIQPYQKVFVRLALFHNELHQFLIGAVVRRLTTVGQQPFGTLAAFFLRLVDTVFLGVIRRVRGLIAGDV